MHSQGGQIVKPSLIDTDILSLFLRNHPDVPTHFASYLAQYKKINISIITYYEIMSGLKHRDAHKKTTLFLEFVSKNRVLPLTKHSATASSEIYAELRKEGRPLDDIDLLIAGVAIANKLVLVTHNKSHFERIRRLEIEDWSEKE
jgi:tRNA(fMet)-specific endonuclease VapC